MNNKNNDPQPTWLTNIYTPEGADRPSFNQPVTRPKSKDTDKSERTVAEIVSNANHVERYSE